MSTNEESAVSQTESAGIVQGEVENLVIDLDAFAIPSVLGDVRDGAINKIPPSSAFALLPRPPIKDLPGIHSADREFGKAPLLAKVEQAYRNIYEGKCSLHVKRITGSNVEYHIAAAIKPSVHDDDGGFKGLLSFVSLRYEQGAGCSVKHHSGHNSGIEADTFYRCLREHQKIALYLRVTHLFLRTMGACLEPVVFIFLATTLRSYYGKYKWSKEFHDLSIICSDVAINHDHLSIYGVGCILPLCDSLEGLEKWHAASSIYQEILSHYWNPDIDNAHKTYILLLAATALAHADRCNEAEIFCIHGLRVENESCLRQWENADQAHVTQVVSFYFASLVLEPEVSNKNFSFIFALISLLICAEIKFDKAAQDIVPRLVGRDSDDPLVVSRDCVKSTFATKKRAQKALSLAVSQFDPKKPNVVQFRKAILKCCKPKYHQMATLRDEHIIEMRANVLNCRKMAEKSKLRDYPLVRPSILCGYEPCENSDDLRNFKGCPCRTISYVSICLFTNRHVRFHSVH